MAEMFIPAVVQAQKEAIFVSTEAAKTVFGLESERDRKGKKMAQPMATRYGITPAVWNDLRADINAAMQRFNDYRAYRRTVSELSDLTSHDLADLGLHRSEIRRVAHDAVYGARR
ncbi:MAG: DUF1127 domain-containing protein [Roseovarius sp.]|nr:DUF1127 domain-containing protein [Roseovarius sp.]